MNESRADIRFDARNWKEMINGVEDSRRSPVVSMGEDLGVSAVVRRIHATSCDD